MSGQQRDRVTTIVTADHGNCEMMIDDEGHVHTAHTTEPVDFIAYDPADSDAAPDGPARTARGVARDLLANARLADVAPTVLGYLGLEPPSVMDGRDILCRDVDGPHSKGG